MDSGGSLNRTWSGTNSTNGVDQWRDLESGVRPTPPEGLGDQDGGPRAWRRGHKRAVVAVARKLAIILHRMWMRAVRMTVARGES